MGRLSVVELPIPAKRRPSPDVALGIGKWGARNQLARDLHDGVGQSLNALLVQIRVAISQGQAGVEDLRVFEQQAQDALHSVRALSYGTRRPRVVDPLREAQSYAEQLIGTSSIALRWIDDRTNLALAPKVSKQIAWSIRESITNAFFHAGPSLIEVRLAEHGERIRATVGDDGVGFSPESVELSTDGRGLGLLGNAERMADIAGTFSVRSRPGEGTFVELEAPRFLTALVETTQLSALREMDAS